MATVITTVKTTVVTHVMTQMNAVSWGLSYVDSHCRPCVCKYSVLSAFFYINLIRVKPDERARRVPNHSLHNCVCHCPLHYLLLLIVQINVRACTFFPAPVGSEEKVSAFLLRTGVQDLMFGAFEGRIAVLMVNSEAWLWDSPDRMLLKHLTCLFLVVMAKLKVASCLRISKFFARDHQTAGGLMATVHVLLLCMWCRGETWWTGEYVCSSRDCCV